MITKTTPLKNNTQAQAHLNASLRHSKKNLAQAEEAAGDITDKDLSDARKAMDDIATATSRHWVIIRVDHLQKEIARLEDTQKKDLVFPSGKFLLISAREELISPAGFHPDQCVFLKPEVGAVVSKLPTSSNMLYHDFTSAV